MATSVLKEISANRISPNYQDVMSGNDHYSVLESSETPFKNYSTPLKTVKCNNEVSDASLE
jgi:hypothetical protein